MLRLLIIIALVLLVGATLMPRLGRWLGLRARKPYRQAKWMWTWFAGSEEQALEAEREYGSECAREFASQFTGHVRPAIRECVSLVGERLANTAADRRRTFVFAAVPAAVRNAYALPGGFIFVTDRLVELCEGDHSEVAFLLAHEMSHVILGHAREKLTTGAFLDAVASRLPGAAQMLRDVLSQGYSRELELETDWEAVKLMRSAGFDAQAALRALRRLSETSPSDAGMAGYFASHPPIGERIIELTRRLGG